jgi:putative peptidoglycan lipid II flippase
MGLIIVFSLLLSALFALIGWLPHGGLALANSLATALEMAALLVLMRRRLDGLNGREVLTGLAQSVAGAAALAAVVWLWLGLTQGQPEWLVALGGVVLGAGVYGIVLVLLGVREARQLLSLVTRRLKAGPVG